MGVHNYAFSYLLVVVYIRSIWRSEACLVIISVVFRMKKKIVSKMMFMND